MNSTDNMTHGIDTASTQTMDRAAVILLAHGSRDPLWRAPIEAIAARIREASPGQAVACAYLELSEPTLPAAADVLIANGERSLRILPVFFGVGKHAREDMPELVAQIQASHPSVQVDMLPTAGEFDALITLMADIALQRVEPS